MINLVGLAFGQVLVDRLDLAWVVVSDANGSEIAVHGQPGDFLIFPTNLVGKRYASGETGVLEPIYCTARDRLAELRSDGAR